MKGIKSIHQQRIEEFMRRADGLAPGKQGIPEKPEVPAEAVRCLRARLILEEAIETVIALGFNISATLNGSFILSADTLWLHPNDSKQIELHGIADGCADLSVVTIGTLSACGLPDEPILREVDENNLAKFRPGHSVDEHGKLVKPPDHQPPDLAGIISRIAG